ncbi:hypothetical protein WICPIJ_005777 [Wickerhamomyces pijperi]|uniref:BZIP domain-containing protein n=1 Tax=Wickerhamomyces pijperi TaxID=599730 RepID=A0A9P8Q5N4_WICPI|nr:hypothetical protein WICPIJ_005777 [Wickerhamomyces pijperi]
MNNQNQTNNDSNITPAALLEQLVYVDTFMPEIDDPSQLDERLTAELSAFADDSFIFPDEEKPQNNDSDSNGNSNANGNANGNNRGVSGNSNNSSGGFNMNKYALLNSSQKNLNNNNSSNNSNSNSSNNTSNINHLNHISPSSTASTTSTTTTNSIAPNDILSNLPKVPVPPGAHSSLLAAGLSQTQIDALAALIAQHQGANQNNNSNAGGSGLNGLNGINLSNLGSNAVNSGFGGNNNNSGNANGNLQLLNGLGLNNNQNQIQQNGGTNGNNISNIVRLQQEMALRKFQSNNNSNTNNNTNSNTQLSNLLSGNNSLSFPSANTTSTASNSTNTANNTNNSTGTSSAASGTSSLASSILSSSTLALLNAQNSNNSRKNSNSGTANNRSNSISDTFTNIDPQQHGTSPDDPSQRFEPTGDTETDKRRRNTAASARFRIKKKLKEQQLERSVRELNELTISLEQKIQTLQMENKLLRNLVVEKSEVRNQEEVELLRMKAKMDGNNGMGF